VTLDCEENYLSNLSVSLIMIVYIMFLHNWLTCLTSSIKLKLVQELLAEEEFNSAKD
jgi:hypothetical protein